MKKKYFKTREEAEKACSERGGANQVFRMPKGSRKAGWYAVCSEIEYLNTY